MTRARELAVRTADGARLHVVVMGDGPPLLLVRPLGGSLTSWGDFADVLAARARVVLFDARGTGRSTATAAAATRAMAIDARAVLDGVGVARAHVYGVSLGGMAATWLAVDHARAVDRLILASTPVRGVAVRPSLLGLAPCLVRPTAAGVEACLAARILTPAFRADHPDEVTAIRRRAGLAPAGRRNLLRLALAAATHDATERLGALSADTLIVAGGDDPIVPPRAQRQLAARLPHARIAVVPGVGHDVSAEAPREVAELVLAHLQRA